MFWQGKGQTAEGSMSMSTDDIFIMKPSLINPSKGWTKWLRQKTPVIFSVYQASPVTNLSPEQVSPT